MSADVKFFFVYVMLLAVLFLLAWLWGTLTRIERMIAAELIRQEHERNRIAQWREREEERKRDPHYDPDALYDK